MKVAFIGQNGQDANFFGAKIAMKSNRLDELKCNTVCHRTTAMKRTARRSENGRHSRSAVW